MVGRYAGAEAEAAHGRRLGERTLGFDPGRRLPLADGLPTSSVAAIQAEHRVAHPALDVFDALPRRALVPLPVQLFGREPQICVFDRMRPPRAVADCSDRSRGHSTLTARCSPARTSIGGASGGKPVSSGNGSAGRSCASSMS
jgi:hypothetical protein